jgi:hypothetical protein
MRTLGGVLLGVLLFFPGTVLLEWLAVKVLGLEDAMTLTERLLVMVIILLSVNLVQMRRAARPAQRHRRESDDWETETPAPRLRYLPGEGVPEEAGHRRRRTASARRTSRRR